MIKVRKQNDSSSRPVNRQKRRNWLGLVEKNTSTEFQYRDNVGLFLWRENGIVYPGNSLKTHINVSSMSFDCATVNGRNVSIIQDSRASSFSTVSVETRPVQVEKPHDPCVSFFSVHGDLVPCKIDYFILPNDRKGSVSCVKTTSANKKYWECCRTR